MRAQAMPGEDPETLPHASEVAARILPLTSPALTETGLLLDVRSGQLQHYRLPE
jgi:hypothetical protein